MEHFWETKLFSWASDSGYYHEKCHLCCLNCCTAWHLPPTINDCPQSSSYLSDNPICPVSGSVFQISSLQAILLACTPMRPSPSLYTSVPKHVCMCHQFCGFLVIIRSWNILGHYSLDYPWQFPFLRVSLESLAHALLCSFSPLHPHQLIFSLF